jgi:hypothetical protein
VTFLRPFSTTSCVLLKSKLPLQRQSSYLMGTLVLRMFRPKLPSAPPPNRIEEVSKSTVLMGLHKNDPGVCYSLERARSEVSLGTFLHFVPFSPLALVRLRSARCK